MGFTLWKYTFDLQVSILDQNLTRKSPGLRNVFATIDSLTTAIGAATGSVYDASPRQVSSYKGSYRPSTQEAQAMTCEARGAVKKRKQ